MAQMMKFTQPGPQHTDIRIPMLQSNIVSRLTAAMIVENLITLRLLVLLFVKIAPMLQMYVPFQKQKISSKLYGLEVHLDITLDTIKQIKPFILTVKS